MAIILASLLKATRAHAGDWDPVTAREPRVDLVSWPTRIGCSGRTRLVRQLLLLLLLLRSSLPGMLNPINLFLNLRKGRLRATSILR